MTCPSLLLLLPSPGITSGHTSDVSSSAPPSVSTTITAAPTSASTAPDDFSSNDYLSLLTSPFLRARVLTARHSSLAILGSGSLRLLIYNHSHPAREAPLARTFRTPAALLFNSGFDANAGFFACVPQSGNALFYDAAIHASVHDGARTSRVAPRFRRPFAHNDLRALSPALRALRAESVALKEGRSSVFVAVESVYSMDGTVAPLCTMIDAMDKIFPARNAHLIVDEAHAMGIYGPGGHGMVPQLGLEDLCLPGFTHSARPSQIPVVRSIYGYGCPCTNKC